MTEDAQRSDHRQRWPDLLDRSKHQVLALRFVSRWTSLGFAVLVRCMDGQRHETEMIGRETTSTRVTVTTATPLRMARNDPFCRVDTLGGRW